MGSRCCGLFEIQELYSDKSCNFFSGNFNHRNLNFYHNLILCCLWRSIKKTSRICMKRELHATISLMEVLRKPLRTDTVTRAHAIA